ncbi:hypothetical protein [Caldibacillus debilis]|uniref:hypothetical protein n=1 Tax=Caldibacillus debilis TaxID=301148 RepID=UPI0003A0C9EB|nr:hypothetical protein [Caldibacillus debilis]
MWKALFVINPVGIREAVPNAAIRQSNTCFSSSDGDFPPVTKRERDLRNWAPERFP